MKKPLKITLWCLVAAVPVGLIIGLCIPNNSVKHISAVGSSGVKPFVETLSDDYHKTDAGKDYDITVDAGGSGFGIGQVAKGFANIGDASKNPYEGVKKEYQQQWGDQDIKTVTIGWEGICVVYIPPKGISDDAKNKLNSILTLNDSNITDLYRTFSGYKDGLSEGDKPYLGLFLEDGVLSDADKKLFEQQQITPYARSGGSLTSGTAASFYESSHFPNAHTGLTTQQEEAFTVGNYGKDWKIYDTDEANSRAWDIFSRNNIPVSMVYLSSGFIKANEKLIKDKGYGIVAYNNTSFTVDKIKEGYNFYRPLDVMLSVADEKSCQFVEYLISNDTASEWDGMGAKQVSPGDIKTMEDDNSGNFWISDIVKSEQRYGKNFWDRDDIVFGALD